MIFKIIKKEDYRRQPWKNGVGFTSEIALEPHDADVSHADFLWRISQARIEHDASFSVFPQHDRILTILSGEGIRLKQNGKAQILPSLRPFEFSGSEAIQSELFGDPVSDFNVFTRRGGAFADLTIHQGNRIYLRPQAEWNFFFAWQGGFTFEEGLLQAGDTLQIQPCDRDVEFRSDGSGSLLYTRINLRPP